MTDSNSKPKSRAESRFLVSCSSPLELSMFKAVVFLSAADKGCTASRWIANRCIGTKGYKPVIPDEFSDFMWELENVPATSPEMADERINKAREFARRAEEVYRKLV